MMRIPKRKTDDGELVGTGLKLPAALYRRAKIAAIDAGMSVRDFVAMVLAEYLGKHSR